MAHWTDTNPINRWNEYKETHSKEEILQDMEEFFGKDSDGQIAMFMSWHYDNNSWF